MKKIKVLHIIPNLGMGGAENITISIAKYLDKEKFDVEIVSMFSENSCVDKYKKIIAESKIPVTFLDKKPGLDISIVRKLFFLIRDKRPDIVHTHLYACVYVLVPEFFNRVKGRVHTVHNIAEKEIPALHRKIMKVAYKFFNVIPIAINQSVQSSIEKSYKLPITKIPVVRNGVDISKFYSEKKANGANLTLINVGRFSPQKNHELLIQCYKRLLEKYESLKLILVGEGELKRNIEQLVIDNKMQDKVLFTGNVINVEDYLAKADIFLMTSDYEGLPLSVIEAMAAGLPIVSTKAGGVVDLVRDKENGILTEVGNKDEVVDAVSRLISDQETRKSMGKKSRELADKYSVRMMTKQYEKLYLKIGK